VKTESRKRAGGTICSPSFLFTLLVSGAWPPDFGDASPCSRVRLFV